MKNRAAILGIFTLGYLLGASSPLSLSLAEQAPLVNMNAQTTVSSGAASTSLGMTAKFTQAAAIAASYEPMDMNKALPDIDIQQAVSRKLSLKIGGLPGETVFMTCNVSDLEDAAKGKRDCGGNADIAQHAIPAGQQFDNGILLTRDLMPNPSGQSKSSVTIEVSYL